jgi:hypothetical protein
MLTDERVGVDDTLSLRCPNCLHAAATLFVNSYTILTVQCVACRHRWSVEISQLSALMRARLLAVSQALWFRRRQPV